MKTLRNEKAVSPVLGVILMVMLTVVLAAVIAAVVFGLYSQNREAPTVRLSAGIYDNGSNDYIIIENLAGDTLKGDEMKLVVDDENHNKYSTDAWTEDLSVGQKIEIKGSLGKVGEKRNIQIIHVPSQTLLLEKTVEIKRT